MWYGFGELLRRRWVAKRLCWRRRTLHRYPAIVSNRLVVNGRQPIFPLDQALHVCNVYRRPTSVLPYRGGAGGGGGWVRGSGPTQPRPGAPACGFGTNPVRKIILLAPPPPYALWFCIDAHSLVRPHPAKNSSAAPASIGVINVCIVYYYYWINSFVIFVNV
jgi:hypothetical protein